ncbi:RICIN domain-containing protein [Frigoribacterium sp. CFBP 13712]|uniref:RICIN domain-containing protein n=1 Tax=Frigoribacterium sp. CFBP 13712 TaxID=2775309 RepID=UPI00177ACA2D|nr:RICIN domain-containing protein [Frigoribacterium sp. CFBP 13712]
MPTNTRSHRGSRRPPSPRRSVRRAPVWGAALVVAVLTALIAVPAEATWTAPVQTASATTSTGRLAVALTGVESLATTYSSSALSHLATVTVANAGTVPAPWTLAITPAGGSTLATATRVSLWPLTSGRCGSRPADASSGTWATVGAPSGTLPVGASSSWCVQTSITQADRFDSVGQTARLTAALTARLGSWTSAGSATSTQTVADTLTPGAPTKTSETDSSISLTWAASSDSAAVSRYGVYRDGVLVGTVPASTRSYTDTGLGAFRYYAYAIRALDASNPARTSPASPAIRHATAYFTNSDRYVVRDVATNRCATVGGSTSGSPLWSSGCRGTTTQLWQFVAEGQYLKITSPAVSGLYWDSASDRQSVLRSDNAISAQRWTAVPVGTGTGMFQFRDRNSLCLTSTGSGVTTQMQVSACTSSETQLFTLGASS